MKQKKPRGPKFQLPPFRSLHIVDKRRAFFWQSVEQEAGKPIACRYCKQVLLQRGLSRFRTALTILRHYRDHNKRVFKRLFGRGWRRWEDYIEPPPAPDPARLARAAKKEIRQGLLQWERERPKRPPWPEDRESRGIPYEKVDEVFDIFIRKGWLTSFGTAKPDMPPSVFSEEASPDQREQWKEFRVYLQAKDVDPDEVEKILLGDDPSQTVNIPLLYDRLRWGRVLYQKEREREVNKIRKRYRSDLQKFARDSYYPDALKLQIRQAVELVFHALSFVPGTSPSEIRPQPDKGLPFKLTVDSARQTFWTPVIVALVEYLLPCVRNNKEAFRLTAQILNAAFPAYPNKYQLVEQRYYRSFRHKTPRS